MPYIGRGPVKNGAFRILDDISGSFNGSTTSFALTVGSNSLTVGAPETLTIAIDGVMQEPGTAFTISGSNIVFGSPPPAEASFWGVELGDVGGLVATATTQSAGDNSTNVATTAYVDAQVATEDTIAEMGDVNITSPGDAAILIYDTSTSTWRDAAVSGDATISDTGVVTIAATAVENSMLADDAVGADELAANAVVNASIASGAAIDATKIADGSVTSTEFQYINSLSSNAQSQLAAKAPLASPTFTTSIRITPQSSAPGSPAAGTIYYDTED